MILNDELRTNITTFEKLVEDCNELHQSNNLPIYLRNTVVRVDNEEERMAIHLILGGEIQKSLNQATIICGERRLDGKKFTVVHIPQIGQLEII